MYKLNGPFHAGALPQPFKDGPYFGFSSISAYRENNAAVRILKVSIEDLRFHEQWSERIKPFYSLDEARQTKIIMDTFRKVSELKLSGLVEFDALKAAAEQFIDSHAPSSTNKTEHTLYLAGILSVACKFL